MCQSDPVRGEWSIPSAKGAEVRLRSGQGGLMSAEANAPVRSGSLVIGDTEVVLDLVIALEKIRMGNFLMQAAARTLISLHRVHDLAFRGSGATTDAISGVAVAGDVTVPLVLALEITGDQLEFTGSASMGTVHIPLPGLGTIEDFSFDVDARLVLTPR